MKEEEIPVENILQDQLKDVDKYIESDKTDLDQVNINYKPQLIKIVKS